MLAFLYLFIPSESTYYHLSIICRNQNDREKMTLELVIDKFKATGCPLLKHADSISNQELIYDTLYVPSEERQQLLSWWVTKLDQCLENVDLVEVLNGLGIFTSKDTTSFVSGNMTRSKQLRIWTMLADIISHDEQDVTNERCQQHTSLAESVSETIEFDKFTTSKMEILPFHLEKEFKKQKSRPGLKDGGMPTLEKLVDTLERGHELQSGLIQYEDKEAPQNTDEMMDAVNTSYSKLSDLLPEYETRHSTEFSSWLRSQPTKATYTELKEVVHSEEVVNRLHSSLYNKTQIADNIRSIVETGHEDIRKLSSGFLTTEFGLEDADLSVTMTNVKISSQAPAAS